MTYRKSKRAVGRNQTELGSPDPDNPQIEGEEDEPEHQPSEGGPIDDDPSGHDDDASGHLNAPAQDAPPSADDALNTILVSLRQRGASTEQAEAIIAKALGEKVSALRLTDQNHAEPPPSRHSPSPPPARETAVPPPLSPAKQPPPDHDDQGSSISRHVSRPRPRQPASHSSQAPSSQPSRSPTPSDFALPDPKNGDPPPINPILTVPDHIARSIAPIAEKKLREYRYIELYYFTRAGRDEAAGLAVRAESDEALNLVSKGSKISLEPSENARTLSNVIRDEKLSWAQLEDAIATFETEAIRVGWTLHYIEMFRDFFYSIQRHPFRDRPFGRDALILYQARVRYNFYCSAERHRKFGGGAMNIRDINTTLLQECLEEVKDNKNAYWLNEVK
ncbi:hypothetical protein K474DRAFT_1707723, partial [Panus rudis PR-1116 ss-1]